MKTISYIAAIGLALSCSVSNAMSNEELCYKISSTNVRMKDLLTTSKTYLTDTLKEIETSGESKTFQAGLRERLFFVENRKNLPDEDLRAVSFLHCMTNMVD